MNTNKRTIKLWNGTTNMEAEMEVTNKELDGRIVPYAEYGRHIELTCINHPNKRWSTKNIGHIGARTIFYDLHGDDPTRTECDCPSSALRPRCTAETFGMVVKA